MGKKRFELLSDAQWELIGPLLPEPKYWAPKSGLYAPRGVTCHSLDRQPKTVKFVERAFDVEFEKLATLRFAAAAKLQDASQTQDGIFTSRTGPTVPRSTVLSVEQEAIIVAFRKYTLLPLDDCLYALQAAIPPLTRSSLHRCLERHGISRLPEGDKPRRRKFDTYPIGFFHIDLAEVRTAEGKLYLLVAIDRTSKFVVAELVEKADMRAAADCPHGTEADTAAQTPTPHPSHRSNNPPDP